MTASVKSIVGLLAASLGAAGLIAALNFVVDPLQLFRSAAFYPALYAADSRLQNAGLIRSQGFDTVFMGTSLAVHFRQSDIDKLLGVHSVKLSMSGGSSVEQAFVLDAAMRRHPRRVIWEMDDWIFFDGPGVDANIYLPADLYRMNAKGVMGYLLSLETARESFWILLRLLKGVETFAHFLAGLQYLKFYNGEVDEINTLPPYVDLSASYNVTKVREALARYRSSPMSVGYDYDAMVRNFESNAFELIKNNPEVQFQVYFPPYPIVRLAAMRELAPETLMTIYRFSAYATARLLSLSNVSVSDFRVVADVTHDLNNYADLGHHSPTVDLKVLSWLAAGKYRLEAAAPEASLDVLKKQVEAYRFEGVGPPR